MGLYTFGITKILHDFVALMARAAQRTQYSPVTRHWWTMDGMDEMDDEMNRSRVFQQPPRQRFHSCSFHGDKIRGEGTSPPTGVHKNMTFRGIPGNPSRLRGLTNLTKEPR